MQDVQVDGDGIYRDSRDYGELQGELYESVRRGVPKPVTAAPPGSS